jgi:hypothetical protein
MLLQDLRNRIRTHREEAASFRRRGYESPAKLIESIMEELDELPATIFSAVLPLKEAAELVGYTERGIHELIRTGKVRPLAGERGETLVYLAELPVKPGRLVLLLGGDPRDVAGEEPRDVRAERLARQRELAKAKLQPRNADKAPRKGKNGTAPGAGKG